MTPNRLPAEPNLRWVGRSWSTPRLTLLASALCVSCLQHREPAPRTAAHSPVSSKGQRSTPAQVPAALEPLSTSPHVSLGIPRDSDPSDDYLLDKGAYVLSYNAARKVPNWVSWNLNQSHLGNVPRHDKFQVDPALPSAWPRVHPSDYAHSGYDRGHVCPAADRTSSAADNAATFFMTNMQPQLHELNDGPWRELEEEERGLARRGKELFLVAGGIFGPTPLSLGRAGVAVPEASYKIIVILERGQGAHDVTAATPTVAAIMPNQAGVAQKNWKAYTTSIDEIERRTGYDYLSKVAAGVQEVIEKRVASP